jgi:hypothetical protein
MPIQKPYEVIAGATIKLTWVSSGAVPSTIACTIRNRAEALITSMAATASGDGHYYAMLPHPNSGQWVVNEWIAVINANTYVDRQYGKVLTMEVD